MKKLFIYFTFLSFLFGKSKWTIILYFACDNDLSNAGYQEILKLTNLGYNKKVRTIILIDNAYYDTAPFPKIYELNNGNVELKRKLPEVNIADVNFFSDFIRFIKENYESDNYFLIFYSHGNGWYHSLNRAFLYDETNQSSLSVAGGGLKEFLKKAKEIFNKKIKILGFDVCLMGMVEIAFEIFDYCDYLFASPSILPVSAWDYKSLVKKIEEEPEIKINELAQFWSEKNLENIRNRGEEGIFSAIDLNKLRKEYGKAFSFLKEKDKNLISQIRNKIQTYPFFEREDSLSSHIDFFHILKELNFEGGIFSSIISIKKTDFYKNGYGLAIFFPYHYLGFKKYIKEYFLLTFQKEVKWLEFLNEYYSLDDIRPERIKEIRIEIKRNNAFINFSKSFDLTEINYYLYFFNSFDTIFYDSCENFAFWDNYGFSLSDRFAKRGKSFYSNEGLLLNNYLITKEKINLSEGGLIIFDLLYNTEETYLNKIKRDVFYLEYSFDKINFYKLDSFYGKSDYFEEVRIFLPQGNYYLRFRYQTDSSITNLGVFIDEIRIIAFKNLKEYKVFNDTNYYFHHLKKGRYYLFLIPVDKYGNKGFGSDFSSFEILEYAPIISLPNPFINQNNFLLDIPKNSSFLLRIYDLKGSLVYQRKIAEERVFLEEIKNLRKEIYLLFINEKGYKIGGKIIKI
ncbi:MAG: clostripain-related cysteine peptidase [candidate division WOR-3 bacterium]